MGDLFNALLSGIARGIEALHNLTAPVFGEHSGVSWGLAIVLLTVCIRLLMYPLFVKQIRTQRAMQALQPKIKELQAKHKGDKETLNVEMMKLYKEHNANPFAGCLPVLLQMPVFIALYQVLHRLAPDEQGGQYQFKGEFGLSRDTVESFMSAKIFGAPIGAGFNSPSGLLSFFETTPGAVKIVAVVLIVAMAATTFFTSKQMMGRTQNSDASQATQQKILLYVMPAMLGIFGFQVAIGVLVYWTTTNLFSMVQQAVVMKRLGPPEATLAAGKAKVAAKTSAKAGTKAGTKTATKPAPTKAAAAAATAETGEASANGTAAGTASTTPAKRPANRNSKNRGKGQRRGGRR